MEYPYASSPDPFLRKLTIVFALTVRVQFVGQGATIENAQQTKRL
jgi:hypothetical protein